MSRNAAYIGSLIIGILAFIAAKALFPHEGIGGEYLLILFPLWVMILEMALLGRGDD